MTEAGAGALHRHGHCVHRHPHGGRHRHLVLLRESRAILVGETPGAEDEHADSHEHGHADHGHSHGLVDRTIVRPRDGVRTVSISLAILGLDAGAQLLVFVFSGSVALLADLIHNFGDALTAVPLGIAFYLRSLRGEKLAGRAVVLAIFVSACVALYATIVRLIHPQQLSHLWVLAAAGVIGFSGNELAAGVSTRRAAPSQPRPDR